MQRKVNPRPYLIQSKAVRDEVLDWQRAAKHKIRGFFLQIHGGAVGAEDHSFADADVGSGNFDPFLV